MNLFEFLEFLTIKFNRISTTSGIDTSLVFPITPISPSKESDDGVDVIEEESEEVSIIILLINISLTF